MLHPFTPERMLEIDEKDRAQLKFTGGSDSLALDHSEDGLFPVPLDEEDGKAAVELLEISTDYRDRMDQEAENVS